MIVEAKTAGKEYDVHEGNTGAVLTKATRSTKLLKSNEPSS